jgi:hypothetical protein
VSLSSAGTNVKIYCESVNGIRSRQLLIDIHVPFYGVDAIKAAMDVLSTDERFIEYNHNLQCQYVLSFETLVVTRMPSLKESQKFNINNLPYCKRILVLQTVEALLSNHMQTLSFTVGDKSATASIKREAKVVFHHTHIRSDPSQSRNVYAAVIRYGKEPRDTIETEYNSVEELAWFYVNAQETFGYVPE